MTFYRAITTSEEALYVCIVVADLRMYEVADDVSKVDKIALFSGCHDEGRRKKEEPIFLLRR